MLSCLLELGWVGSGWVVPLAGSLARLINQSSNQSIMVMGIGMVMAMVMVMVMVMVEVEVRYRSPNG